MYRPTELHGPVLSEFLSAGLLVFQIKRCFASNFVHTESAKEIGHRLGES